MAEDAKLETVRKLLAKAEGTSNEHEAALFLAKAQQMMTQYGIDEARARAAGHGERVDSIEREMIDIPGRTQLIKAKRALLAVVAEHNNCIVLIHGHGQARKTESITGYRGDRDRVKLLFTSLLLQMERSMRQPTLAEFRNTVTWRNNFAWGYVSRINARLEQARAEAYSLAGGGAQVALRDTIAAVKDAVGKTRKAPAGKRRAFDADARAAGHEAGNRAVLEDRLESAPKRALS